MSNKSLILVLLRKKSGEELASAFSLREIEWMLDQILFQQKKINEMRVTGHQYAHKKESGLRDHT